MPQIYPYIYSPEKRLKQQETNVKHTYDVDKPPLQQEGCAGQAQQRLTEEISWSYPVDTNNDESFLPFSDCQQMNQFYPVELSEDIAMYPRHNNLSSKKITLNILRIFLLTNSKNIYLIFFFNTKCLRHTWNRWQTGIAHCHTLLYCKTL